MFEKFEFCVPFKRRLELLTLDLFIHWVFYGELLCVASLIIGFIYGPLIIKSIIVIYLVYAYHIDKDTPNNGWNRQGSKWVRDWSFWKKFRDYFPIKLIKTVDLPPTKNYVFACYPHGLLGFGPFISFSTNALNFSELFPGIRSKLVSLSFHFTMPIFRELALAWGMNSCAHSSVVKLLSLPNDPKHPYNNDGCTSNAIGIICGGAQESLNLRPRNYQIVLKKRKGFIKLAIQAGADIVPVVTYNEVDTYDQPPNPPGSLLRKFQDYVKGKTGMSPVIYMGRGLFQTYYGIMPKSVPLVTVIGAPIHVDKNENPTTEEIEKLHAKFTEELILLFETHKSKYVVDSKDIHLIIE